MKICVNANYMKFFEGDLFWIAFDLLNYFEGSFLH